MKHVFFKRGALLASALLVAASGFADEPKRKASTDAETAAADVFIKIPSIPGDSKPDSDASPPAEMDKVESTSAVAEKPAAKRKATSTVRPTAVRRTATIAPAKPEPQSDTDNTSTKSGGINTIQSGCTLEEKIKGNKICPKDD